MGIRPGQAKGPSVSSGTGGGGGGAPVDASYVVMGLNGTLTQERVLTAGAGIVITDGGAGGAVTVAGGLAGFPGRVVVTNPTTGAFEAGMYWNASQNFGLTAAPTLFNVEFNKAATSGMSFCIADTSVTAAAATGLSIFAKSTANSPAYIYFGNNFATGWTNNFVIGLRYGVGFAITGGTIPGNFQSTTRSCYVCEVNSYKHFWSNSNSNARTPVPVFTYNFNFVYNDTADTVLWVANTNNAAGAGAGIRVEVAGGTANDPFVTVAITSGVSGTIGIDNSASDIFGAWSGSVVGTNQIWAYDSVALCLAFLSAVPTSSYQWYAKSDGSAIGPERVHRHEFGGGANGKFHVINVGVGDAVIQVEAAFGVPYIRWTDSSRNYAMGTTPGGSFFLTNTTDLSASYIFAWDPGTGNHTLYAYGTMQFYASTDGGIGYFNFTNGYTSAGSKVFVQLTGGDGTEYLISLGPGVVDLKGGNSGCSLTSIQTFVMESNDLLHLRAQDRILIDNNAGSFAGGSGMAIRVRPGFLNTAPSNPANNGDWCMWVGENAGVYTFEVRFKDSGGTVRAGSFALT